MQPEHHKSIHAAMLGSLGGLKRSAISRHAAWSCWHPREAQEITYLVTQALKNGKQLPLV